MNYEMANSDNPEEIILATQRSFVKALKGIIADVKETTKQPGLTWEQIDYLLTSFGEKKPTVITQEKEM